MKQTRLAVFLAAFATSAWSQTGFTADFGTTGQPIIHVESKLEPETPRLAYKFDSGTVSRNKVFQRYLYNKTAHEYFGYSVLLEQVSGREYRITLGPIQLNPAEHPIYDPLAQLMPSPIFPPAQLVSIGDRIAVDFFENPKTGQKIVDYLWLERQNCDGDTQKPECLAALVADSAAELEQKMQSLETRLDAAAQTKLRQSQQSWETYRDDSCAVLSDRSKQLECKSKLTRNRIRDLETIYP